MTDFAAEVYDVRNRLDARSIPDQAGCDAIDLLGRLDNEIERLRVSLRECSDDLATLIDDHYAGTLHYPSQKRRYDRDMDVVLRARAILNSAAPEG